jgi:uncharacterized protein (DUF1778 family)
MGRPLAVPGKHQSKLIALRLTPSEYKWLEQAARGHGLTISDYIRQELGFRKAKR